MREGLRERELKQEREFKRELELDKRDSSLKVLEFKRAFIRSWMGHAL